MSDPPLPLFSILSFPIQNTMPNPALFLSTSTAFPLHYVRSCRTRSYMSTLHVHVRVCVLLATMRMHTHTKAPRQLQRRPRPQLPLLHRHPTTRGCGLQTGPATRRQHHPSRPSRPLRPRTRSRHSTSAIAPRAPVTVRMTQQQQQPAVLLLRLCCLTKRTLRHNGPAW